MDKFLSNFNYIWFFLYFNNKIKHETNIYIYIYVDVGEQ